MIEDGNSSAVQWVCHLFYQFIFNIQNIYPDLRLSYCHAEGIHNPEISRLKLVTRKPKHLKGKFKHFSLISWKFELSYYNIFLYSAHIKKKQRKIVIMWNWIILTKQWILSLHKEKQLLDLKAIMTTSKSEWITSFFCDHFSSKLNFWLVRFSKFCGLQKTPIV